MLEATGSVFTNKYAEGYPGKRYYGGCEYADVVENLARDRAKKLFHAEYANVQPHSGSQANQAAYASVLNPGDTILGMNLSHGGHLTHGHPLNFSGKTYKIVPYGVRREDERIDYDELARLAEEHKPKMIIAGGSAYPRIIDFARFRADRRFRGRDFPGRHGAFFRSGRRRGASESVRVRRHRHLHHAQDAARPAQRHDSVQGKVRRGHRQSGVPRHAGRPADARHRRQGGLLPGSRDAGVRGVSEAGDRQRASALAAGLHEAGFRVVSGGTDTHLMLVDVFAKGVRGKEAEAALDRAYITANKNAIPFDVNPPLNPSGMRFGSPAVTTRGFREPEMREVAALIAGCWKTFRAKMSWPKCAAGSARSPTVSRCTPGNSRPRQATRSTEQVDVHIVIDARRIRDFGIGTYIRNLIRALARLDRENRYTLIARPQDADELAGLGRQLSAPRSMPGRIRNSCTTLHFRGFLRTFHADLYHIPLNSVAWWMPQPYVVTIHDMSSLLFPDRPRLSGTRMHEERYRRGALRAARVITVSNSTRRDIETVLHVPPDRIRTIYSAPDPAFTASAPRSRAGPQMLDRYSIQYPFILYAGTIRAAEEYPAPDGGLRRAARRIRAAIREYQDLRLVIIGDELSKNPSVRRAVVADPHGARRALSGLRAHRDAAGVLSRRRRIRLPIAVRRLRPRAARSHGLRHAGGGFQSSRRWWKPWATPRNW